MASQRTPLLAPPPPLRGTAPGSFAHDTISRRMPAIAKRVLTENELSAAAIQAVTDLIGDLPDAPIRPLRDPGALDLALWDAHCAPFNGQSWLKAPWFFSEIYFYRRILEATGYFQPGAGHQDDPFSMQKRLGLEHAEPPTGGPRPLAEAIAESLWGNQADLSLWPAGESDGPGGAHLLADNTAAVAAYLEGLVAQQKPIALVLDNAGAELLHDLALADALLAAGLPVKLHAKPHPTFVSDATAPDVLATIAWLAERLEGAALGGRLREALERGKLTVGDDWYWTSPLVGWDLVGPLRDELAACGLIISKGDANYRRWLGDRPWPVATPLNQILNYSPAPLLLLRTCKSDVAAGIDPDRAADADAKDPAWRFNGRWGLIQFSL